MFLFFYAISASVLQQRLVEKFIRCNAINSTYLHHNSTTWSKVHKGKVFCNIKATDQKDYQDRIYPLLMSYFCMRLSGKTNFPAFSYFCRKMSVVNISYFISSSITNITNNSDEIFINNFVCHLYVICYCRKICFLVSLQTSGSVRSRLLEEV